MPSVSRSEITNRFERETISPMYMNVTNRPGDLKNLTKKETADLILEYADMALELTEDGQRLAIEFDDGRILTYCLAVFPAATRPFGLPTLREWSVQLYTLKQRTPRCLRRWYNRHAWLYLAPYWGEGYKTDSTGRWRYNVWR